MGKLWDKINKNKQWSFLKKEKDEIHFIYCYNNLKFSFLSASLIKFLWKSIVFSLLNLKSVF